MNTALINVMEVKDGEVKLRQYRINTDKHNLKRYYDVQNYFYDTLDKIFAILPYHEQRTVTGYKDMFQLAIDKLKRYGLDEIRPFEAMEMGTVIHNVNVQLSNEEQDVELMNSKLYV